MKKKLSILIALVMAITLCLVPAVAQAQTGSVQLVTANGGIAEWSTDQASSGTRSAHISIPANPDVAVVRISLPSGSRPQLSGITALGFEEWVIQTPGGYGASFDLKLVPNEADVFDPYSTGQIVGTDWDIVHLEAPLSGGTGSWLTQNVYTRTDIWLHSDSAATIQGVTDLADARTKWASSVSNWYVAGVEVIIFGGAVTTGYDGYIDDININGTIYDLEVSTTTSLDANVEAITAIDVSPTSIDFGTITAGTPVSGPTITVENIGTVAVQVNASLDNTSGAFKYLYLEGVNRTGGVWSPISGMGNLLPTLSETCTTELQVPATYSAQGSETAILTFTAQTK